MKRILSFKATGWIISVGLSLILIAELRGCKRTFTKTQVKPDRIDTFYKEKISFKDSLVPVPYLIETVDTFYASVDTLAILKDYFATKKYLDTISLDNGTVVIAEHISENSIKFRNVSLKTNEVKIVEQSTLFEKPRNKIFIGSSLSVNSSGSPLSFSIDGVFIPKSDRSMYQVGFDPINKTIRAGAAIKISIKKEKEFEKR